MLKTILLLIYFYVFLLSTTIAQEYIENILIEGNQIVSNNIGIAVKDSSFAKIKNNLFYSNKMAIALYQKDSSTVGGIAEITNNCFYKNISTFNIDSYSKATVLTNISDGVLPRGETKVFEGLADSLHSITAF